MDNDATATFLMAVAALSSFSAINTLMRRHPIVACIATFELVLGPLFIYIGLNTQIIL